ncbi:hypothetical protein ACFVJS_11780, partial [Nocardioides sp. NPDC057772]|uniref:hypothetical protein n=1 Tax=Nocardioides sp. NPDC057772 TaxID=3346245 RepID=UPI003672A19E
MLWVDAATAGNETVTDEPNEAETAMTTAPEIKRVILLAIAVTVNRPDSPGRPFEPIPENTTAPRP